MSLAAGNAAAREDELLRLRQENSELKKANLEKGDTVKKLGVQLTRIQADWKSAAAPKDLAPVAKAHAKADASKAERISELEVELSQRAAREQKLQQQLALLKAGGAGPTSKGSAGVTRQRRVGTGPAVITSARSNTTTTSRPGSARASAEGIGGGGDRMGELLSLVAEKDRALDEMRARLAVVEQERRTGPIGGDMPADPQLDASAAGEAALKAESAALAAVPDGAVAAELRRQVKKGAFEMSLLEQRYSHLDARFTTLRDNHDRLLSQMTELNAALKKERIERTGLQQQLQAAEVRARTRMRARTERTHAAHHERSSHTLLLLCVLRLRRRSPTRSPARSRSSGRRLPLYRTTTVAC